MMKYIIKILESNEIMKKVLLFYVLLFLMFSAWYIIHHFREYQIVIEQINSSPYNSSLSNLNYHYKYDIILPHIKTWILNIFGIIVVYLLISIRGKLKTI
ncbi:hypothetical protein RI065_04665 [Mycoplasmatota bacterium zrk1]